MNQTEKTDVRAEVTVKVPVERTRLDRYSGGICQCGCCSQCLTADKQDIY